MLAYLLPKSFLSWLEIEVRARAERLLGITDRQLDLAEAELAARHVHSGISPAIEAEPVNRIGGETNGKARLKAAAK